MGEKRTNWPKRPCEDCGHEMLVAAGNQRYCTLCALGRAAAWADGRTHACACGREYIAWAGPKSHRVCGYCFIERAENGGREAVEDVCAWVRNGDTCHSVKLAEAKQGRRVWVFHPRLKICYPCLHDPAKFEQNQVTIKRKYLGLREGQK